MKLQVRESGADCYISPLNQATNTTETVIILCPHLRHLRRDHHHHHLHLLHQQQHDVLHHHDHVIHHSKVIHHESETSSCLCTTALAQQIHAKGFQIHLLWPLKIHTRLQSLDNSSLNLIVTTLNIKTPYSKRSRVWRLCLFQLMNTNWQWHP